MFGGKVLRTPCSCHERHPVSSGRSQLAKGTTVVFAVNLGEEIAVVGEYAVQI